MNTIRKTSKGYNYTYADLAETHRYLEESGERYYQEIEVVNDTDYIVTVCTDSTGKELRRCRGCRIPPITGKGNPAQEAGSALTYARRYSLWMAFGLATSDDDGETLHPRPDKKAVKPDKPCKVREFDRQTGVDAVKRLIDKGTLQLSEVQAEVRKYGVEKMQELSHDDFRKCVTALTKGQLDRIWKVTRCCLPFSVRSILTKGGFCDRIVWCVVCRVA